MLAISDNNGNQPKITEINLLDSDQSYKNYIPSVSSTYMRVNNIKAKASSHQPQQGFWNANTWLRAIK